MKSSDRDPFLLDFRKLRIRRLTLNITQAQLAELVDCNRNHISYWERNVRVPTFIQAVKVGRVLGTPLWDLFDIVELDGTTSRNPWKGHVPDRNRYDRRERTG